jgi:DNA-binding transcriptional MerR regulator
METINWEEKVSKLRGELIHQHLEGRTRWRTFAAVKLLGVPASRLRFWEDEFPFKISKSAVGGERHYNFNDMNLLLEIIRLLEVECYTIKGARRQLLMNPSFARRIIKKP